MKRWDQEIGERALCLESAGQGHTLFLTSFFLLLFHYPGQPVLSPTPSHPSTLCLVISVSASQVPAVS